MASTKREIDLLLIGKTGGGKSALGNSILRRHEFQCSSDFDSATSQVQYEYTEFKNKVIKVVDAPGIADTRLDEDDSTQKIVHSMSQAIAASPQGYHAFLLVVKFGNRFTKEEQKTIAFLKKIFGLNFVKKYCILVITCGDHFETEFAETSITFEKWCEMQEGIFRDLYEECNKRVLLFDNRTKDETKKTNQVESLINMLDILIYEGHCYNDIHFQEANKEREKLYVESKIPMIREETIKETRLIIDNLNLIRDTIEIEESITPLNELLIRTNELYNSIENQDKGTGALHMIVTTIKDLKDTITNEITFHSKMCKEKAKWKEKADQMERLLQEEIQRINEEYQKRLENEQMDDATRRLLEEDVLKKLKDLEAKKEQTWKDRELALLLQLQYNQEAYNKRIKENEERYKTSKAENDAGILKKIANGLKIFFGKSGK